LNQKTQLNIAKEREVAGKHLEVSGKGLYQILFSFLQSLNVYCILVALIPFHNWESLSSSCFITN